MSIKDKVLLLLEENKNKPLSGEELADTLGCTRAAVWKAVKTLQADGYKIAAVNNKGYTLEKSSDVLSEAYIIEQVKSAGFDIEISTKKTVDSTNNILKAKAANGYQKDCILIAEEQTAGKGRRGRSFFSPAGTGIYISLLLHPTASVTEASMLTTLAVTAEALAIESVSGDKTKIKWVNDLWMREKKVSGILTEAGTSIEDGSLEYAVVGIGINLYEPAGGFPDEIKDIAGSVFTDNIERENLRNNVASELIINFLKFYYAEAENGKISRSFLDSYKERCFVIGKEVSFLTPDHEIIEGNHGSATVLGINENCHLHVKYEDGTEDILSNGEISIKL